jgi:biotin operon repressor
MIDVPSELRQQLIEKWAGNEPIDSISEWLKQNGVRSNKDDASEDEVRRRGAPLQPNSLSQRVLRAIAENATPMSNNQIAKALGVKKHTVRATVSNLAQTGRLVLKWTRNGYTLYDIAGPRTVKPTPKSATSPSGNPVKTPAGSNGDKVLSFLSRSGESNSVSISAGTGLDVCSVRWAMTKLMRRGKVLVRNGESRGDLKLYRLPTPEVPIDRTAVDEAPVAPPPASGGSTMRVEDLGTMSPMKVVVDDETIVVFMVKANQLPALLKGWAGQ